MRAPTRVMRLRAAHARDHKDGGVAARGATASEYSVAWRLLPVMGCCGPGRRVFPRRCIYTLRLASGLLVAIDYSIDS